MRDAPPTARLLAVARGEEPPDTVIEGARVFCAFTREWLEGDVAIVDGRFAGVGEYAGGERIDGSGRWLSAGFIDAHMHVESCKLGPAELARVLLARGTTAIVCDPHELANVLGPEGVHWFVDVCSALPLDVLVFAPSAVPASPFESPRAPLSLEDIAGILARDRVIGLAEMMNFPAVIAGDPAELAKLEVAGATHVDGHAPGVMGPALDAYLATGIRSDHEATTYEEALAKRRRGAWVLLREASNARNLLDLLPLVLQFGPDWCAFCTDDREPDLLVREGSINHMCRLAVAHGLAPEDAILLASLHPARLHGLTGLGAVAPGYRADLQLLGDLEEFRPWVVLKDGAPVVEDGVAAPVDRPEVPIWVRQTVRNAPVGLSDLRIPSDGAPVRVIGARNGQLLTDSLVEAPTVRGGAAVADPERDLAKIAVVERHHGTGRVGRGFVRGIGLRRGAVATTVAHDAHNIVVVGVSDDDMALCVSRLGDIGGGIVLVDDRAVVAELALPIAGLLSDRPAGEVVEGIERLEAELRARGVTLAAPFTTLSFLALSVIPSLKITDRGLVDVDRFALVPLQVDSGEA
jgi:adenine deaminase